MTSRLHPDLGRCFERLPDDSRVRAREAYRRFAADPAHPGLRFKRLHSDLPLWSAPLNDSYRAVFVRKTDDEIVYFFIRTHAEYDRLLQTL